MPRTEVLVDFRVGDISYDGDAVEVPVEIDMEAGGAGGGAGGGGDTGAGLEALLGSIIGRGKVSQAIARIRQLMAGLATLGPEIFVPLIAVAGMLAATLGSVYLNAKVAMIILKALGNVLRVLIGIAKKAAEAFVYLAKHGIVLTIDVLKKFTEMVINTGKAVTQHLTNFLKTASSMFGEFQQSIANAVAATGLFGDAADQMRETFAHVAKEVTADSIRMAKDAADALGMMVRAGRSAAEALAMVGGVVQLSEATLTDMNMSVMTLNATMNQFAILAGDATRVTNALVAATLGAPGTIEDLRSALKYVGSTASMLNIPLEQTLGLIMGLEKQGREGSRAGMELQNVFKSLVAPTRRAMEVLGQFGISVEDLSIARRGVMPVLRTLEEMGDRLKALHGERRGMAILGETLMQAFTMRAGRGLAGLLMEGVDSLDALSKSVTGTNMAAQVQEEQLRTLYGAWMKLVSLWENVYYDVLERAFAPAVRALYIQLRDLVAQARELTIFERFGSAMSKLAPIVSNVMEAIGPSLLKAVSEMVDQIPGAIRQIGQTVQRLMPRIADAIANLPETLAQVISQVLPMLLRFLEVGLPLFLNFATTVLPRLITGFTSFGTILTNFLIANGDALIRWFEFVLDVAQDVLNVLPSWIAKWDELKASIHGLVVAAAPFISDFLDLIIDLMPIVEDIVEKTMNLFMELTGSTGDAFEGFGSVIKTVLEWIRDNFEVIVGTAATVLTDFFNVMKGLLALLPHLALMLQIVTFPFTVLGSAVILLTRSLQLLMWTLARIASLAGKDNAIARGFDDIADGLGAISNSTETIIKAWAGMPQVARTISTAGQEILGRAGTVASRAREGAMGGFGYGERGAGRYEFVVNVTSLADTKRKFDLWYLEQVRLETERSRLRAPVPG